MSQPPADEPWGARVVQVIDSGAGLLVELDAPCTPTGSPDYTLLVIVPLAHPFLASAEADKWWLTLSRSFAPPASSCVPVLWMSMHIDAAKESSPTAILRASMRARGSSERAPQVGSRAPQAGSLAPRGGAGLRRWGAGLRRGGAGLRR